MFLLKTKSLYLRFKRPRLNCFIFWAGVYPPAPPKCSHGLLMRGNRILIGSAFPSFAVSSHHDPRITLFVEAVVPEFRLTNAAFGEYASSIRVADAMTVFAFEPLPFLNPPGAP